MAHLIPLAAICIISTLHQICCKDNSAQDFIELTKQPYFVDHSELMRYFYEDSFFTTAFVSCPRGFGKTINLQMIQLFNDLELDSNHKPKPMNETQAYKIFSKLAVGHEQFYRWIRDNVAQHPVISIDLNTNKTLADFDEKKIIEFLNEKLYEGFVRYKWILDVPAETLHKINLLQPYRLLDEHVALIKKLSEKKLANKFEIGEAFYRFAHFLQIYFQSGVLILIDDYDSAFVKSSKPTKQQIEFFYAFVNDVIKHFAQPPQNEVTRNIWVAGTTSMLYPEIVKDIEKAYITSCLEGEWVLDYYGYSETDVAELARKYKLTSKQTQDLKKHYGGYMMQNYTTLYNPSSVTQYLKNLETEKENALKRYWKINKDDDFLRGFRDDQFFRDIVQDIVNGGTTEYGLIGEFNTSDTKRFINLNEKYQYRKTDYNALIKYVFEQGYVSYNAVSNDTAMFSTLGYHAPNVETARALSKIILE